MTDSRIEMIKFVLAFIALILVILGIYTYTNQDAKKTVPTSSSVTQKVEVEEKVLPQAHEVKVKKSSVKNITVKSPKVVSEELNEEAENKEMSNSTSTFEGMQDKVADFSNIGKGLTLESIQNSDVSEHEKELMLDDLAANQSYKDRNTPSISEEEGIKALTKEFN